MNAVEIKKQEIMVAAERHGLGVRFTQTNYGNFACTSRVYIYPANNPPYDCRGKSVIKCWDFKQPQNSGITNRCNRFRIYQTVLDYIKNYK